MEIEIRDANNNVKGKMSLSKKIFDSAVSGSVVHGAVVSYLANQRHGTHATKTRAMVRGGGKKPWKQKKTGRSRHGSIRSPIWRGGGIVFGPQPRDYSINMPKNMRKAALYKALTMKLTDGEIGVIDSIAVEKPSTKAIVRIIEQMGLNTKTLLIVLPQKDENIILSVRNVPAADVIPVSDLNAYYISTFDYILFTAEALSMLQDNLDVKAEVAS
jgi:large subunit ribosomal protein L4